MKPDVLESIAKMTVNGNRLELPKKEHFSNYGAVKKALINAGGRYNKNGFCFKDAQATYDSFLAGEVSNLTIGCWSHLLVKEPSLIT
jgi:hypothetical protein